jgi:trigger factor
VLELAKVTDTNGAEVDLSDFVRPAGGEEPNMEDMIQAAQAEAAEAEEAPAEGTSEETADDSAAESKA